jgi:2-oxoisovalerate dehydrogenase E2 component (dihydrolipoyl transacylase)
LSRYVFKLPDLGEGTVDAEIISWRVKPGDVIAEDDALVEMMTEKATVEVPSPVGGRIISVSGAPGDRVTVGSELVVFETEATAAAVATSEAASAPSNVTPVRGGERRSNGHSRKNRVEAVSGGRVLTSPAIRRRAREAGIDLGEVTGSGPSGRIMRSDLAAHLEARPPEGTVPAAVRQGPEVEEIKVIGLRRVIAERMSESARSIPHFSYVEELDVTELEALRTYLNGKRGTDAPALTYLPFLILALTRTLAAFPQCNGLYDAARGVIVRHRAVHVGIATQTRDGLKVPVVHNAERRSLEDLAREIRRLSEGARNNTATRAELTGSTITVTSLGKLGGIASTPIINAPELAIIGVNRAVERPVVMGGAVAIRRMMNLSSSFDHRFVDGHDAAAMIQSLKERLEHPAMIFAA